MFFLIANVCSRVQLRTTLTISLLWHFSSKIGGYCNSISSVGVMSSPGPSNCLTMSLNAVRTNS